MPYVPLTIGLKFNTRINQLTARDVLVVRCLHCGKVYRVAPHVLYDRYPEMTQLGTIEKDLRCGPCGRKGGMSWNLERAVGPEYPRSV